MKKADGKQLGVKTVDCQFHGPFESVGVEYFGIPIWSNCPNCETKKKDSRPSDSEYFNSTEFDCWFSESGIVPRYRAISLDNFDAQIIQAEAYEYAKKFAGNFDRMKKRGQTLIFCGDVGTGKTRLACAILQTLRFGRYVRSIDISRDVRDSISTPGLSEKTVIQSFVNPMLLVIDEVGVQSKTENAQMLLTDIIDRRYGSMRPTIIVSNLNEGELADVFGQRAWDRINHNCLICPVVGESLRK